MKIITRSQVFRPAQKIPTSGRVIAQSSVNSIAIQTKEGHFAQIYKDTSGIYKASIQIASGIRQIVDVVTQEGDIARKLTMLHQIQQSARPTTSLQAYLMSSSDSKRVLYIGHYGLVGGMMEAASSVAGLIVTEAMKAGAIFISGEGAERVEMLKVEMTANGATIKGHYTGQMAKVRREDCFFKKWAPHGEGKVIIANGDWYDGLWLNGRFCNRGTYETSDGKWRYEGQWRNGERVGYGKLFDQNSHGQRILRYEGEWVNGQFHGRGTRYEDDGRCIAGVWREGTLLQEIPIFEVRISGEETEARTILEAVAEYGMEDFHEQAVAESREIRQAADRQLLIAAENDTRERTVIAAEEDVRSRLILCFAQQGTLAHQLTAIKSALTGQATLVGPKELDTLFTNVPETTSPSPGLLSRLFRAPTPTLPQVISSELRDIPLIPSEILQRVITQDSDPWGRNYAQHYDLILMLPSFTVMGMKAVLTDNLHLSPHRRARFNDVNWFHEDPFATDPHRTQKKEWILISHSFIPGSLNQDYSAQQMHLRDGLAPPYAHEQTAFLTLHYLMTNERLYPNTFSRCEDMSMGESRVSVGFFNQDGLYLKDYNNDDPYVAIGVGAVLRSR